VLSEVEQRILAQAIEPNPASGVSIADAHRDQPNMRAAAVAGMQRCGDDFADDADGNGAERILSAVFTGKGKREADTLASGLD
jgi:hypothetical protein